MDQKVSVAKIDNKFASHYDAIEQELKSNTVGTNIFFCSNIFVYLSLFSK